MQTGSGVGSGEEHCGHVARAADDVLKCRLEATGVADGSMCICLWVFLVVHPLSERGAAADSLGRAAVRERRNMAVCSK